MNEKYPDWTTTDESNESEPDDKHRWPYRGQTALVIAANEGHAGLVEWLLSCHEIESDSTTSQKALIGSVRRYNAECVLKLLRSPKVSVTDECLTWLHLCTTDPDFREIHSILGLCIGRLAADYRLRLQGIEL